MSLESEKTALIQIRVKKSLDEKIEKAASALNHTKSKFLIYLFEKYESEKNKKEV